MLLRNWSLWQEDLVSLKSWDDQEATHLFLGFYLSWENLPDLYVLLVDRQEWTQWELNVMRVDSLHNCSNYELSCLLVFLQNLLALFLIIVQRYFLEVDVTLLVSENVRYQILTSNTSVAKSWQNCTSHLEFWLRNWLKIFQRCLIDWKKVEQVSLQWCIRKRWHEFFNAFLYFLIYSWLLNIDWLRSLERFWHRWRWSGFGFKFPKSRCEDWGLVENEVILMRGINDSFLWIGVLLFVEWFSLFWWHCCWTFIIIIVFINLFLEHGKLYICWWTLNLIFLTQWFNLLFSR